MKLKDVYAKPSGIKQTTKLKTVGMPMPTVQKNINHKPPLASKFLKRVSKKFKQKRVGKVPNDEVQRYQMPIPPIMGERAAK